MTGGHIETSRRSQGERISLEERQRLLSGIPLLKDFPPESVFNLAALVSPTHIDHGWGLSQPFDRVGCVVIIGGQVKVNDSEGQRILGAGSVLFEKGLIDPTIPTGQLVTSIGLGVDVLILEGSVLKQYLATDQDAQQIFAQNVASRLA